MPTRAKRNCKSAATTVTDPTNAGGEAADAQPHVVEERGDTVAAHDIGLDSERVGAMLRARRLQLGLSQADVASAVKLPARRIESMENERWDELPEGPYLRGFLRNVARALQLDAAVLTARVDAALVRKGPSTVSTSRVASRVTLPRRSGRADGRRNGSALVLGAFAFAMIAALIAWSGTDSFGRALALGKDLFQQSGGASSQPVPIASKVGKPVEHPVAGTSLTDAPTVAMAAGGATVPQAVADAGAASTRSSDSPLTFHFSEESWVEVRSADGKVLLQRLNAAGTDQEVAGEPPFVLIVGNAKGVAVRFHGQPVDLTRYTHDSVARFTLS